MIYSHASHRLENLQDYDHFMSWTKTPLMKHIRKEGHEREALQITRVFISSSPLQSLHLLFFLNESIHPMIDSKRKDLGWWINMAMYTFFVLGGQSAGTLLGRLYFAKGGKSIWLSTVLQLIGFPAFIPLYYILPGLSSQGSNYHYRRNKPKPMNLAIVYITLGLLVAANSILYSIGLQNLPVSTYSLICAPQLAFNGIFAFFLTSQKFTPYILNSIVLLTVTSTLLIFQNNSSDSSGVPKGKYAIGFVCTVVASAGFSLMLSLTQFAFKRVLKTQSFVAILDICIYQQLIWIALAWGVFTIGALELIVQVSSLFSNVISTLGLPLIPVLAMIFFHEKMDGIMVMAMLLAIWGFISYLYQHYLDFISCANKNYQPRHLHFTPSQTH